MPALDPDDLDPVSVDPADVAEQRLDVPGDDEYEA